MSDDEFECSHEDPCESLGEHWEKRTREWAREEAEKVFEERIRDFERDLSRGGG